MDTKPTIQTSQHLSSTTRKFSAYKIKRNDFNVLHNNEDDYVFEENKQTEQKKPKFEGKENQENLNQINTKKNEENVKSLLSELHFPNHIKISMNYSPTSHESDSEVEDFTEAWNEIEESELSRKISEKAKGIDNNLRIPQEEKEETERTELNISKDNDSGKSSSYELSPEEIKAWMKECQENSNEGQNNCNEYQSIKEIAENKKDWGSWEEIVNELEKQNEKETNQLEGQQETIENLLPIEQPVRFQEANFSTTSFTIIDPIEEFYNLNNKHFIPETETEKHIEEEISFEETTAYGPFKQNAEYYEIYGDYHLSLVQEIRVGVKGMEFSPEDVRLIEKNCRCLRKINWEIQEEKKPNIKWSKMRKVCRTTVIEHNKDFHIADHTKFSISPINEGVHIYFGMRMFGIFAEEKESESLILTKLREMRDYLYLPSTGECLLETKYSSLEIMKPTLSMQNFDIVLSLTKEKIACCERTIQTDRGDKKELVYIRAFDMFEKCLGEYLGLIESKISQFSDQWYCETTIFIPKNKEYSKKFIEKDSDKLKTKLRLSELGSIVAELGIYDATSSVTNSILFSENKSMQFMMATIDENDNEMNLLTRFAGISPLIGFVAAVCRKLFVHYPEG